MQLKNAMLTAVLLSASALAGCGGGYYRTAYIAPPPRAQVGVVGYAPGPGYVWQDGFWDLRGNQWVWAGGRWARAPYRHSTWVRSYWEPRGHGYRFHHGYWR